MEFSTIRENAGQETSVLVRLLSALGGLLAGAGVTLAWGQTWGAGSAGALGVAGPMALWLVNPHQATLACLLLAGGLAGALAGYWAWLGLAFLQCQLAPLPVSAALKRAALPFVAFLPQLTYLILGCPAGVWPWAACLVFSLGVLLLALAERKDKRKIFFAFPTESEYEPSSIFTHGALITLGGGMGWYVQSLPSLANSLISGLWFPVLIGGVVWILSLALAQVLGLLYTKHTFNQIYQAVALSSLPLALLPLQSLGWTRYAPALAAAGGYQIHALPAVLAVTAGLAALVVLVICLLRLSPRPVETQPAWEELFRALMLVAAIPLLIIAAAFAPGGSLLGTGSLAGPLDFFREGEPLASAQAIILGRLPFKEILFRHGFLTDAVMGLSAVSGFGGTVESLRLISAWLLPLGVLGIYYLGVFCLPWMWVLVVMTVLLSGKLGMVGGTRFLFAYVGFVFTFLYLQRERWPFLIGSGVATVLAVIASFSAGLLALAGHGVLLAAYALFGPAVNKRRWLGLALYAGAVVLGMLPWWLYLGMSGSLGDYFANFSWVLTQASQAFCLPVPAWGPDPSAASVLLFLLPPVLVVLGIWSLAASAPKSRERGLSWNVLLLATLAFLLWMRFLQRGEQDFLKETLPVCALLGAFFLFRWSLSSAFLRAALLGGALLWTFVPTTGGASLPQVAGQFGTKNLVSTAGLTQSKLPGLGAVCLPPAQAQAAADLAGYLDGQVGTTETFYDFSNRPLLYFLVPRRPVVQSLLTASLTTPEQQLDAIQRLADAQVKTVVFGTAGDVPLGGVWPEVRQYLLAEYLLHKFTPLTVKGGCVLLGPRGENPTPDAEAAAALQHPLLLGALPAAWGQLSKYDPGQGTGAGALSPADGVKSVQPAGLTVTAQNEELAVGASSQEVTLALKAQPDESKSPNVLSLQLKVPPELDGASAVLAWGDKASGRWVSFRLVGDGLTHAYVLRLGSIPGWVLAGKIETLQLKVPAGGWAWEKGSFLAVRDIPQLQGPAAPAAAPAPAAKPEKAEKGKPAGKKK
jgi:hypothetical protein